MVQGWESKEVEEGFITVGPSFVTTRFEIMK